MDGICCLWTFLRGGENFTFIFHSHSDGLSHFHSLRRVTGGKNSIKYRDIKLKQENKRVHDDNSRVGVCLPVSGFWLGGVEVRVPRGHRRHTGAWGGCSVPSLVTSGPRRAPALDLGHPTEFRNLSQPQTNWSNWLNDEMHICGDFSSYLCGCVCVHHRDHINKQTYWHLSVFV